MEVKGPQSSRSNRVGEGSGTNWTPKDSRLGHGEATTV